jgi:hypothetical protein
VKAKKMPRRQPGGTTNVDEFLALLLELESLNPDAVRRFGQEMRNATAARRRSHIPNKTS